MPYSSGSALNPNGTWQTDGIDQLQLANRQHAFAQQQALTDRQQQERMRDAAMARLASEDRRFDADRSDRNGERAQSRQDQMNMFAAGANLTRDGWAHADNTASHETERAIALLKAGREPNSLEQAKYDDEKAFRNTLMGTLGLGGATPEQAHTPSPDHAGINLGGGLTLPGFAQPSPLQPHDTLVGPTPHGVPIDNDKLHAVAALQALVHNQPLPDFQKNDAEHRLLDMKVGDAEKDSARSRIRAFLDAGDVDSAKAVSQQTGVELPHVDSAALMARPEVAMQLERLGRNAEQYASSPFANDESAIAGIKQGFAEAVHTLETHGLSQEEATAVVASSLDKRLPGRSGLLGRVISDLGYALVLPNLWGGSGRADRVNGIRDAIGY